MTMECVSVGMNVDIKRTDGRVHAALISGVNSTSRSVTVEWFEEGETKYSKEIELEQLFGLNPELSRNFQTVKMAQQLAIPCLGRDMELGTLYDCRTEKPILENLWTSKKVEHCKTSNANETSSFTFIAENNSVTNASALDVFGNVKLSVCSGLVSLRGAAEYLNNFQSSANQARVILKYSCRSGSEKLIDIAQMAPDHSKVFENRLATHVVAEVEYGVDAFFIFTREIQKSEDRHQLELAFKGAMEKYYLPIDKGEATIRATGSKNENRETANFSCTFHGDIGTRTIALNFEEALKICRNLPEDARAQKRPGGVLYGTAKMVHLYPLCAFDPRAVTISCTIDSNITDKIERFLAQFYSRLAEVTALETSNACRIFGAIEGKVKNFKRLLECFLDKFKQKLAKLIPNIRDGKLEQDLLLEMLKKIESSPYNIEVIKKWINDKKSEFNCLENYMETFKNSNVEFAFQHGDMEKFTHNSKFRNVLVLSLGTIISEDDNLLNAMEKFTVYSSNQKNQDLAFGVEEDLTAERVIDPTLYLWADCDGCRGQIRGIRFKCYMCRNYDLCSNCLEQNVHDEHPKIRITSPLFGNGDFSWWQNDAITSYLNQQMNLFCNFAKENKNNENLKYIAAVRCSEDGIENPGTVFLYKEGKQGRIFQVPSPPRKPRVTLVEDTLYEHMVRWSPPSTNAESVIRYRVYFRRQKRSVSRPLLMWALRPFELAFDPVATSLLPKTFVPIEDTWNSLETKGNETELEIYCMMSTGYEFHFEVAAITECGKTAESERTVYTQ